MTYTLIGVYSITYAMKSKNILNNLGYYCEIERQERNSRTGCGYVLRVRDDPQLITGILERNGIKTSEKKTVERGR